MRFINRLAITSAAIILAAMSADAGVVFEVETTYHSGSTGVDVSEMSVEKPNLKMEIASGSRASKGQQDTAIFRGDRREMVVINHEEQYYMVMDAETMNQVMGDAAVQIDQAMKEVNKHLEGLDPAQRAMVEELMKGNGQGLGGMGISQTHTSPKRVKSDYRNTGETAVKNGYPCVKYEVLRGGQIVRELWVTDWDNVKGSGDIRDTFKEMADFWEEMMESTSQLPGGGFMSGDRNDIDIFTHISGFPIVTRDFQDGELESETVLKSVSERTLDPDDFEPPSGYKRRTMMPQ
ncbi:MAG: hypothetical protein HKN36_13685 [Hellea sp.]|nr:hypothetical protein [Hellea sp.]